MGFLFEMQIKGLVLLGLSKCEFGFEMQVKGLVWGSYLGNNHSLGFGLELGFWVRCLNWNFWVRG